MGRENEEAALRHERTLNEIASARCARIQGAKNPRACKKERERERENGADRQTRGASRRVATRRDAPASKIICKTAFPCVRMGAGFCYLGATTREQY
jgi:hypothetical protein